eukprot:CAMPEP_0195507890 /NCGR_PEP_ID=MMETSP0794_2-20130614/1243_1 /TAXON_ID=515487 /ORGANISM="Stephanopyxis turris, Strain CCMP 815" /LENGTH=211 /DNA_ID=CAMNT_0040634715 /DNA_START=1 /DNA_END=633 /DNA_ORIENTATION=-
MKDFTVKFGLPPLGIQIGEADNGRPGGIVVGLPAGGQGQKCGLIRIGDIFKSTTVMDVCTKEKTAKIRVVDCTSLSVSSIFSAIQSNRKGLGINSVVITFSRPFDRADNATTSTIENTLRLPQTRVSLDSVLGQRVGAFFLTQGITTSQELYDAFVNTTSKDHLVQAISAWKHVAKSSSKIMLRDWVRTIQQTHGGIGIKERNQPIPVKID